jgi:uncharacterized protein GlcG (DUF336 family)
MKASYPDLLPRRVHPARLLAAGLLAAAALPAAAQAPAGTHTVRLMTPETALKAAEAALARCRQNGHQVAVAVTDRTGLLQVLLRDRFAGAHTVEVAMRKAWTAASFRIPTKDLGAETQPGQPMSGLRGASQVLPIGGGLPVEAGGSTLGAIGVSGAPGGDADDACARAGIDTITDAIEF